MLPESLIKEAQEEVKNHASGEIVSTQDHIYPISVLAADYGLTIEKVSDTLYVSRDLEEDGQKFDFWLFCKYGPDHHGQTITMSIIK